MKALTHTWWFAIPEVAAVWLVTEEHGSVKLMLVTAYGGGLQDNRHEVKKVNAYPATVIDESITSPKVIDSKNLFIVIYLWLISF